MAEAYLDERDAIRRLEYTICMWKGEPKYIRYKAEPDLTYACYIYNLKKDMSDKGTKVNYKSDDFSIEVPPLGYANVNGDAYYIERSAIRDQRAGLPIEAIRYPHGKAPDDVVRSQGMYDMFMNRYPSIKEVISDLQQGKANSLAFSRNYAIVANGLILKHRDHVVGSIVNNRISYREGLKKVSFHMRSLQLYERELNV